MLLESCYALGKYGIGLLSEPEPGKLPALKSQK
jgi:hypothetical protein